MKFYEAIFSDLKPASNSIQMNSMVPFKLVMCEYHTVWTEEWFSLSERVIFFDPAGSLSAKCGKLNQLW